MLKMLMRPAIPTGKSPKQCQGFPVICLPGDNSQKICSLLRQRFYSSLCSRLIVDFNFKEEKTWGSFWMVFHCPNWRHWRKMKRVRSPNCMLIIRIMPLPHEGSLPSHNWLRVPWNGTRTRQTFVHSSVWEAVYTMLRPGWWGHLALNKWPSA